MVEIPNAILLDFIFSSTVFAQIFYFYFSKLISTKRAIFRMFIFSPQVPYSKGNHTIGKSEFLKKMKEQQTSEKYKDFLLTLFKL